jgi:hypothetical protein
MVVALPIVSHAASTLKMNDEEQTRNREPFKPHEIVVFHHFLDRVRERDRHGQGQTFGHGHNQDSHSDDEEGNELIPVLAHPGLVIDTKFLWQCSQG